jgi:hypothetical protein
MPNCSQHLTAFCNVTTNVHHTTYIDTTYTSYHTTLPTKLGDEWGPSISSGDLVQVPWIPQYMGGPGMAGGGG